MNNGMDGGIPRAKSFDAVIRRSAGLRKGETILGGMTPLPQHGAKRLTGGVKILRDTGREEAAPMREHEYTGDNREPREQRIRRERPRGFTHARPRTSNYARTGHGRVRPVQRHPAGDERQKRSWLADQGLKAAACAAIALCVWGFTSIDSPVTNAVSDGLSVAVNAEMNLDSEFGRLKFVENLLPDAAELVFWQQPANAPESLATPCDGEISIPYDERLGGVTYSCLSDVVSAAADGVVTSIDRDADGFLRVSMEHEGGLVTRYGHLNTVLVRKDERVTRGSRLALMAYDADVPVLGFSAVMEGRNVDPGDYIGKP